MRNDQISDLHNKIPTKATIGVGSIVGNVGREVMLTGVWLISDSLEALYVNTVFSRDSLFDLLWARGTLIFINTSQKQILMRMFEDQSFAKIAFKEIMLKDQSIKYSNYPYTIE